MSEKRTELPITLREAFENDLTGSVRLNPFPWNGEVYEIENISHLPVKTIYDRDGQKKDQLSKRNVFEVKLRGLKESVELSGSHELLNVERNKIRVETDRIEKPSQPPASQPTKTQPPQAAKKS